jgi:hypothetical protein
MLADFPNFPKQRTLQVEEAETVPARLKPPPNLPLPTKERVDAILRKFRIETEDAATPRPMRDGVPPTLMELRKDRPDPSVAKPKILAAHVTRTFSPCRDTPLPHRAR